MSLFDTLLGSTSSGKTNNQQASTQDQVEEKNTTQNTTAVTNQNQSQSSAGKTNTQQANTSQATGQTNSLNQDVVNTVSGLIKNLAGGNGDINTIVSSLIQKAGTPAISEADIKAQGDAAKLAFGQGEAVEIGRAQNAVGSKMNTYSELLAQKGEQDLATVLSGIVANARSTNAQISTSQLVAALEGTGQESGQIAQLVSALKGANTSTSQNITGSTSQDTTQQLLDILNGTNTATQNSQTAENTAATASGSSTSNTQGKQGSGLLGMLF